MKAFFDAAFSLISCLCLILGVWWGRDLIIQLIATLGAHERYCDRSGQPLNVNCNFEQPRRRQKKAGETQPPLGSE